ncbi:MAG: phosphotransferase [Alphaproteobacteria bacterium]|nr:phosphotransferase [Alphaproteobacteria bacterium]
MWKFLFDFCYFLSFFIPNRKWRDNFRINTLFDYKRKLHILRRACPDITFRSIRMIKGGWNIGFIINKKYVFKIRKKFTDSHIPKIIREKRITDAFRDIVPLKIPKIDIISAEDYTFYKYEFIRGHNLNTLPGRVILKHRYAWAKQLAQFIFIMHNSNPDGIQDLITEKGDGWCHNDICNNVIVDTKTMRIVGLIDWEYSGWNYLETEFVNCTAFSSKLRKSNIGELVRAEYKKLSEKNKN